MAKQLRALAVLPVDPNLIPTFWSQSSRIPIQRIKRCSRAQGHSCHINMQTKRPYTNIHKTFKK